MTWYYLKQIVRSLYQKKFNSLVKIIGITFTVIPLILIWSFVSYESGYDRFLSGNENVYRVIRNWQEDKIFGTYTSVPFLPALLKDFPEIKTGTRLWPLLDHDVIIDGMVYNQEVMLAVDSSFFNTLGIDLLTGDKNKALADPGSVVLSKSMSAKLYGKDDPAGKIIEIEGNRISDRNRNFIVTGVYDDFPSNSHLKGNFILSLSTIISGRTYDPTNHMLMTYLRLNKPADKNSVEKKLPGFMESFYGKAYYDYARSTYLLQPVTDIHLDTGVNYNEYETAKGSKTSLYVFPSLVLLIILIASFNFVNLTISEGSSRLRSFGVSKIWGAGRVYFLRIYIYESLILTLAALFAAYFILSFISPLFVKFVERDISPDFYWNPLIAFATMVFALILGTINGLIPALRFSRKNMIEYLKEKTESSGKHHDIQTIFQIAQFAICVFLIIGSFVVFKQLRFITTKTNQSLDSENILVITNAEKLGSGNAVFINELRKMSAIKKASACGEIPGLVDFSHWGLPVDSAAFNSHVAVFYCDYDYLSTLDMQLVKGRFFDPAYSTDNKAIVLNETAVRTLGWENDPIGKRYRLSDTFRVIGVVKDIHFESFHHDIIPQGFFLSNPENARRILVKIEPGKEHEVLGSIGKLWSVMVPDRKIQYNFLDDDFDFWYKNERKTGQIAIMLTLLAVFLSTLGFLALLLIAVHRRTKEIGIRKVNGARVREIVCLFNSKYLKWVAASYLLAFPAGWYAMHKWLQNFAYRTDLSWWIFFLSGLIALGIAFLTVTWHSSRAASRNPVDSLRYE